MNWKASVAFNFNSPIEIEGPLKVRSGHAH